MGLRPHATINGKAGMRILVRAPNWIGDQILAYPFFYYLRKAYPKATIVSACVPWVESIQFRDLVDEVFILPRPARPTFWARFQAVDRAGAELRQRGSWDLAISLPNSFSAAWLLWRSGAKVRRGYQFDARGWLMNDRIPWNDDPNRHRSQAYVDLLPDRARPTRPATEFWGVPPQNDLDQPIPGERERFPAETEWKDGEALKIPEGDFWILAPGATADSRRWPEEFFVALARRVQTETGWPGVIIGGPTEAPLADRMRTDSGLKLLDYTARCPVSGLAGLFSKARFTVCNESGLAHVAALCGSPVQIVCGAADPRRTRPIGPGRVNIAVNPVECWPCERNVCIQVPEKKIQCLRGIQADTVWEGIRGSFLRQDP